MLTTTILDVNNIFFTVLGYPMSYIEFFGTIFTGWSVFLAAKNKVLTWPIGLVGIVLYLFLFYQINLYSDLLEQIYYLVTSFWGWFLWTSYGKNNNTESAQLPVSSTKPSQNALAILVVIFFTGALSFLMSRIHIYLPAIFPVAASFVVIDSFTTILSFLATIYLAKRRIENWYLWILVDVIGIWLYYQKGVVFLSLLYLAFLINAFVGLFQWKKLLINSEKI